MDISHPVTRRPGERGEGNLGCILWAVIMVILLHVAWVAIPAKVASAEIQDFLIDEAAHAQSYTAEQIKKRIIAKGADLGIDIDPKKVKVTKQRQRIRMQVAYTQKLEFFGSMEYDWNQEHDVDRPIFIV
jgi:hypothetical protein